MIEIKNVTKIYNGEKKAINELSKAKSLHDEIEKLYKVHVDFEKVTKRSEELIFEIGF